MSVKERIKNNPKIKPFTLWLLMPLGQARPRWWVSVFINPFVHNKSKGSLIRRRTRMEVLPFQGFSIGKNSTIEDFCFVNNGKGAVSIGDGSRIGISNTLIGPIRIGNNVILAQNVVVSALNHGYENPDVPIRLQPCTTRPVTIDDDCWIGANVVITSGVKVGKHSVVAAGSVVTKEVPAYCIVAGNPARIIKRYNPATREWEKADKEQSLKIAV